MCGGVVVGGVVEGRESEPVLRIRCAVCGGEGDGICHPCARRILLRTCSARTTALFLPVSRPRRKETMRPQINNLALQVRGNRFTLLARFWPVGTSGARGAGGRSGGGGIVDDTQARRRMLRDIVGFHRSLQRHCFRINRVDGYAYRPVVVRRGFFGGSGGGELGMELRERCYSGGAWWVVEPRREGV